MNVANSLVVDLHRTSSSMSKRVVILESGNSALQDSANLLVGVLVLLQPILALVVIVVVIVVVVVDVVIINRGGVIVA
jgi:hypothetical protein